MARLQMESLGRSPGYDVRYCHRPVTAGTRAQASNRAATSQLTLPERSSNSSRRRRLTRVVSVRWWHEPFGPPEPSSRRWVMVARSFGPGDRQRSGIEIVLVLRAQPGTRTRTRNRMGP